MAAVLRAPQVVSTLRAIEPYQMGAPADPSLRLKLDLNESPLPCQRKGGAVSMKPRPVIPRRVSCCPPCSVGG